MQKLKKIASLIKKHNYNLKFLTKMGFKKKNLTGRSSGFCHYFHYRDKIVVKIPYLCERKFSKKYLVPTVKVKLPKVLRGGNSGDMEDYWYIFIQPMVQVDSKSRRMAYNYFLDNKYRVIDLHSNNVGMYNGKPVLIDW